MESFQSCMDRAEYLIQEAEQVPLPESRKSVPSTKWKSFRRKVHETYAKALTKTLKSSGNLQPTSNLLPFLVSEMKGSRLLVNLFPLDNGYTITLLKNDGTSAENLHMPYEEHELLDYIDNEELPPILVDTLHRGHNDAFICGAVLAEIRDFRIATDETTYETSFVLLKPTQQTLINDVNIIAEETSDLYKWGVEDKLALESCLTLATAEPLCLDNSPTVAIIKNKMQARKKLLGTPPLRKHIQKNSMQARKRAQVLSERPAPSSLKLHDFLIERKKLKKDHSQSMSPDVKLPVNVVDIWRKTPLVLSSPQEIDAAQYMKASNLPNEAITKDDIIEVQSILLESESTNRDVCSRITIGQRLRDMQYFGMLQSNKYFKQNIMDVKDTDQIFSLGTENRANLYILQYYELFTEDGRRPAKVTVYHANQTSSVYNIPNQHQPWQVAQEKSAYSVGSVINIPMTKWKKMNVQSNSELKPKIPQSLSFRQTQKTPSQGNTATTPLSATTPTLNAITLQNASQNAFNFPGARAASVSGRRLSKAKSNPSSDGTSTLAPIQTARRGRTSIEYQNIQSRAAIVTTQSVTLDGSKSQTTRNTSNQSFTMNSAAIATALGQIGGSVSVQVPVMTVSAQRNNKSVQKVKQQNNPTTAVIRMPVGINNTANSSNQITAALNLLSGGQNVLSNLQLTGAGGITIPASQLPANIAMQLTSVANTNPQQISLIATSTGSSANIQPQQISLVGQSGSTQPFTIVANDNWQLQEAVNSTKNQQTYTIAPRTQISSTRPSQPQQQQQVQVVQQLRIPAHLLSSITGSNQQVQQLMASSVSKNNAKRKSNT